IDNHTLDNDSLRHHHQDTGDLPRMTLYEVSVWFDGAELQFLSVEKVIENKLAAPGLAGSIQDLTRIDPTKQSSNGSVGSLGPFQLPSARPAADSHSRATESSGTISSQSKAPLSKVKHTVRGAKALASLMIEEFTKIKRALSKDDELSDAELDQSSSKANSPKTTPLFQVQQRMLRSPTRHTFFRPRRPDMPSFSRQWYVCFPASPCFGNSSAFRKVTLPALVSARPSSGPRSGGPSSRQ
ncbi:hypothetical protein pipiens_018414, partial [Culex pipiens pipiens]